MPRVRKAELFDHLVGARDQRRRHVEAERPGGLEVDNQLELGRLHDRQFRRSRPFENSASTATGETPRVRDAGTVTDQAAASDGFSGGINDRDAMPGSQGNELVGSLEREWIRADQKRRTSLASGNFSDSQPYVSDMPITLLEIKTAFGPEDTTAMTVAFDEVLKRLNVADREAPIATSVAKKIVRLAKRGERNPARLTEGVISSFRAKPIPM
jgi:hypothetical protein